MNDKIKELIEKMGEDEVAKILENSYEALTEEYMTFGQFKREVESISETQIATINLYSKYQKVGLVPIHDKLYGRKHVYNYLVANHIVELIGIEQAVMVKMKLVTDQDNTIELINIYEELMKENIRSSNNTLKGLAMIAKGRRLL